MATKSRFILRSPSVVWLVDHPDAVATARREVSDGGVFADLVVEDPTRLSALYTAITAQSVRAGAPFGVTEDLLRSARHMATLADRWTASGDADRVRLGSLKGLRDRDELTAALHGLLDGAPDERTRATIERLARYVSQELTAVKPDGADHVVITITNPVEPVDVGRPGPTDPGVSSGTGTTEPPDPGSGEAATVIPEPADGPLADLFDQVDTVGSAAAADFAEEHGLDVDRARELGGYYATQTVLGFQSGPVSDTSGGSFGSKLWCAVFGTLGAAIAGPAGFAMGCTFGAAFSTTGAAHEVTTAIQNARDAIQAHVTPAIAAIVSQVINCVICDHCENCQLAEQVMKAARGD
jgi:hypothetical protein